MPDFITSILIFNKNHCIFPEPLVTTKVLNKPTNNHLLTILIWPAVPHLQLNSCRPPMPASPDWSATEQRDRLAARAPALTTTIELAARASSSSAVESAVWLSVLALDSPRQWNCSLVRRICRHQKSFYVPYRT